MNKLGKLCLEKWIKNLEKLINDVHRKVFEGRPIYLWTFSY